MDVCFITGHEPDLLVFQSTLSVFYLFMPDKLNYISYLQVHQSLAIVTCWEEIVSKTAPN